MSREELATSAGQRLSFTSEAPLKLSPLEGLAVPTAIDLVRDPHFSPLRLPTCRPLRLLVSTE